MKTPRTDRHAAIEGMRTDEGFRRVLGGNAMSGPHRKTRPLRHGRARRFFAALLAFLLAPSPFENNRRGKR